MSENSTDERYWPHPLIPWLEECASKATPLLAFAPLPDFKRNLEIARFEHPIFHEDEAKRQILATYHHAMALVIAIAAGGGSRLGGEDLHHLVYLAAEGDHLAFALCDAAAVALAHRRLPAFKVSSRLPGFSKALSDWAGTFSYDAPFSGRESLRYIVRDLIHSDHDSAGFWLNAASRDFSPQDYMKALTDESRLFDDTLRKRSKRNPKPPARYKSAIAYGWIPWSLWARTASGIHYILDPKGNQDGGNRVKRDISELGFSSSHCGELQKFIDD